MTIDCRLPAERLLARHAERRRQGLATLSVLVGPPAVAAAAWVAHAGGPMLTIDPATAAGGPAALAAACAAAAGRQCNLLAAAVAEVARRLGRPPEQVLAERSAYDLEQLWRALPDSDGDADLLVLIRTVCAEPIDGWGDAVAAALPGWRAVVAIDRALGDVGRPAVWIEAGDAAGWLSAAAGPLAALATAVPRWSVGVGVTDAAFDAYRSSAGVGRPDTLVCGGVVPVDNAAPGVTDPPILAPTSADDEVDDDDPARSAAERFLFDLLEARWPGLFALNRPLDFPFGSRAAEADLFASSLRLVIEIDGYHHFLTPDAYRRDRRKDWAYQSHGYRLVRVLAEDVVPRQGEILDRIAAAVDHCRRQPMGAGPTGNL